MFYQKNRLKINPPVNKLRPKKIRIHHSRTAHCMLSSEDLAKKTLVRHLAGNLVKHLAENSGMPTMY